MSSQPSMELPSFAQSCESPGRPVQLPGSTFCPAPATEERERKATRLQKQDEEDGRRHLQAIMSRPAGERERTRERERTGERTGKLFKLDGGKLLFS